MLRWKNLLIFNLLIFSFPFAFAGNFASGFALAVKNDPAYQAALAEKNANLLEATKAGRAYWPELGIKVGERSEGTGQQRTVQVAQPLIDVNRYTTLRGAEPLGVRAEATMLQREAELILRYYKAVAELIQTREGIAVNAAKTDAISQQAAAAKRTLELGTGTVTDLRDAQVRLSQAQAEQLSLSAKLGAAEREYQALTGEFPSMGGFNLSRTKREIPIAPLSTMMATALEKNPSVVVARQNQQLAELDVTRKWGDFAPKLNFIAKQTTVDSGASANYVGVAFDYPLQSGNMLDVPVAKSKLLKANEETRAAEQRTRLDVERLYSLIDAGRMEAGIRLEVIAAAELSLQANEKSFQGGVRSRIDVLNSIQQVSQTRGEYVTTVLKLGEDLVNIHILIATPSTDVIQHIESLLF